MDPAEEEQEFPLFSILPKSVLPSLLLLEKFGKAGFININIRENDFMFHSIEVSDKNLLGLSVFPFYL